MIISILKPLLQMLHSKTAESVIHSPHLTVQNLLSLKEVDFHIQTLNMLHSLLHIQTTAKEFFMNIIDMIILHVYEMYHMSEKYPGLGK